MSKLEPAQSLSRRWIIAATIMALALVLAANAHLIYVAVTSQPACVPVNPGQMPAKKSC